ncbi:MAG TPA: hypothetical protein VIW23_06035 [Candidatus Acidoferrum sp.]|jgi:hypothetical protein
MRFKTFVLLSSFSLLIGSILIPATSPANRKATIHGSSATQVADGTPLPLPKPPAADVVTLVADGTPLPLPKPPANETLTLIADGTPLPLPKPPANEAVTLMADGTPLPLPKPPANMLTLAA